jgi:hypothetical protein
MKVISVSNAKPTPDEMELNRIGKEMDQGRETIEEDEELTKVVQKTIRKIRSEKRRSRIQGRVSMKPTQVSPTDYAAQEYGMTPMEIARVEKRIRVQIKTARKRGEMTRFTGARR